MVSSGGGDLLLVQAIPHPTRCQTIGFKIFKLLGLDNVDNNTFAELVEIDNLGNDAFFLGVIIILSLYRLQIPVVAARIAYTTRVSNHLDTNVYSLEDRSFTLLRGIKTRLRRTECPPPIWIVPMLV